MGPEAHGAFRYLLITISNKARDFQSPQVRYTVQYVWITLNTGRPGCANVDVGGRDSGMRCLRHAVLPRVSLLFQLGTPAVYGSEPQGVTVTNNAVMLGVSSRLVVATVVVVGVRLGVGIDVGGRPN